VEKVFALPLLATMPRSLFIACVHTQGSVLRGHGDHVCDSYWGVRYESQSTGRVFYRNRNTGQTQWTHPGLASSSAYLYQAPEATSPRSPLSMDERQAPCASRLYAGTPSIQSLTSFPNLSEHRTPPANGNSTLASDIESVDRSRSCSPRGSGNDSRGRSITPNASPVFTAEGELKGDEVLANETQGLCGEMLLDQERMTEVSE